MNRRTYLAALTSTVPAGLAGCVDALGGVASPGTPDGVHRRVRLVAVDDAPAEGLTMEATVAEPSVTDEHPARVAVTTTNEGRERDVSVNDGGCCLFNRNGGASDPAGLWLHRVGSSEHVERAGDRWTRDRPADEPRAYAAYACLSRTYAAGESLTNEYHVWDDYRTEGYLEPGRYRFAEPVTVSEPGDVDGEAGLLAEFTWGFEVAVRRP